MAQVLRQLSPDTSEAPIFSVVIPAFNEEAGIGATLESLVTDPIAKKFEIIVVDDGSTDRTREIVSSFQGVKLISHPTNQGYGAAIRSATIAAAGEFIIWFDSDGQHRVEDLLSVAEALQGEELDYVIGKRDKRSHEVFNRRFGKALLRWAARIAAGQPVQDFNCGLRGFRRTVLVKYLHLLPKGFGASTTTTLLMLEQSYRGRFIPVVIKERVGKSTVRQVRDGVRTLMLMLRIFLIFKPMLFFGSIGGASILLGFAYGVVEALARKQGFPVLAAVVILFGFQSLFFGLICDQIGGITRERMGKR